ncbi:MAG: hypothetical protein JWQ81_2540 [Amycolatopsis sp.]|nr:hypothetical protein [Amycolatopsis sp.]
MSSLAEQMQKFCLQLTGCDLYTLASPVNGVDHWSAAVLRW